MASMLSPSRSRSPYGERGLKCDGSASLSENWRSLSLRRAWIEIYRLETLIRETKGRSPYGERGLKFIGDMALQKDVVSLSLRRAWIEICCINIIDDSFRSLSLRRAWIEIARTWEPTRRPDGRSPYGERGLKYRRDIPVQRGCESLSLRRAWIEITSRPLPPPTRSSLSLRRAWIEITIRPFVIGWPCRSPYGERGLKWIVAHGCGVCRVALLTESVD